MRSTSTCSWVAGSTSGKSRERIVEIVQKTEYPWDGSVSITVNPEEQGRFRSMCEFPIGHTSKLYKETPQIRGVKRFAVNGHEQTPVIEKGYAVVTREWKPATRSNWSCQWNRSVVTADDRIKADAGLVALKYGPLIYNVEIHDNANIDRKLGDAPLRAEWRPASWAAWW